MDYNLIINYKLSEFINNLNKKYNASLDINEYIINDEVKRCVNRVYDCGKNKNLNINKQCSRAVFVNNLCRQCACSDKETGNVNETPPEWLVTKYQTYIDKNPQEFKNRDIKNEINLDKYEVFMKKKNKKNDLIQQNIDVNENSTDKLNCKVNETNGYKMITNLVDTTTRNDNEVNEAENKANEAENEANEAEIEAENEAEIEAEIEANEAENEAEIEVDLEDTTNRFDDSIKLNNGKVYYTVYSINKTKDLEIGKYNFIKIENITDTMKNYNINKQIMDEKNFILHPITQERCLQIEIFEHDYKNYHWLPKIYYECDYNSEKNKITVNNCIYNKDYCCAH